MSTHNIGFYEDLTKLIFELSSNTHIISSVARQNNLSIFYIQILKQHSLVHILSSQKNLTIVYLVLMSK